MASTFGGRVRDLREDSDMTQERLAKALHMTQRKISYIERDEIEPSLGDIIAYCHFFKVSADFLLGLTP